jgi:LPXTG-motif cell wall-anchored protein
MEITFLPETLSLWLTQYGSFALFALLALGIFAIPIPDETLMVFAGILVAHDRLSAAPTCIAAFLGAMTGITLSYSIGRIAGVFLIKKYGHWVGITEAKMQRVHNWFERFGRWALLIGYFVPGVRHLTGYAAGITVMEYRHFATFAYIGAVVWATLFLSIGYFVGDQWSYIEALFDDYWQHFAFVGLGLIVAGGFLWWLRKRRKVL